MRNPFRLKRHANIQLSAQDLIPPRVGHQGVVVNADSARRLSAVWAALRLRADLVSTMPFDVYRTVRVDGQDVRVEVPTPPVLVNPGGARVGMTEWLYSTQIDLDSVGNSFGIITEKTALGLPARIDLVPTSDVSVRCVDGAVVYRIHGVDYPPEMIWHEKQYTASGLPVGLSPLAYAAWTMSAGLSAQQFAADWFSNDGVPSGHLKNTAKMVPPKEAAAIKDRFRAAVSGHDLFVTGSDWEYSMIGVPANQAAFIEQQKLTLADVARFLSVPVDMIDGEQHRGNLIYANISQRNLQLLILHLNPAIRRREEAFTRGLLPAPRFVEFNRDGLLQMDPAARAAYLQTQINSRVLTPDEARAIDNRQPLTEAQYEQFARLFPGGATAAAPDMAPPDGGGSGDPNGATE